MTKENKAKLIADQCKPCTTDFYNGIYQGVIITLNAEEKQLKLHSSYTTLPADKLQELIDETYNFQVQELDTDTLEESFKLGIREGCLVAKHYYDDKLRQ